MSDRSRSSSPTSVDWVDLSGSEPTKVVFTQVKPSYSALDCVICCFEFSPGDKPLPDDFVGLYRVGYKDISDCYAAVDFKLSKLNETTSTRHCVVFKAEEMPKDENDFYQFLYVRHGHVFGSSSAFLLQATVEPLAVSSEDDFLVVHPSTEKEVKAQAHKAQVQREKAVDIARHFHVQLNHCLNLLQEKKGLEKELQLKQAKLNSLNEENEKEKASYQQQLADCISEKESLKSMVDEKEKSLNCQLLAVEEEKTAKTALKREICELSVENERLQKVMNEQEKNLKAQEKSLKEAEKVTNFLKEQVVELCAENTKFRKLDEEKDKELDAFKLRIEADEGTIHNMEKEISCISTELNVVKKSMEAKELKDKIEKTKAADIENEASRVQISQLSLQNDDLKRLVEEKSLSMAELLNECEGHKVKARLLNDNKLLALEKLEHEAKQNEMLDIINKGLEVENFNLKKKLQGMRHAVTQDPQFAALYKQLDEKENMLRALDDSKSLVVEELNSAKRINAKLRMVIGGLELENDMVQGRLVKIEKTLSEVSALKEEKTTNSVTELQDNLAEAANLYKKQFLEIHSLKKLIRKMQKDQKDNGESLSNSFINSIVSTTENLDENAALDFVHVRSSDSDTGEHVSRDKKKLEDSIFSMLESASSVKEESEDVPNVETPAGSAQFIGDGCNTNGASKYSNGLELAETRDSFECTLTDIPSKINDSEMSISSLHNSEDTNTSSVQCPNCPQTFPVLKGGDTNFLMEHLNKVHDQSVCPICGLIFEGSVPSKYFTFHVENHFGNK